MKILVWHHEDPIYDWLIVQLDGGLQARLTPHMLTGLPSASSGVRFLLNFLPPASRSVILSRDGRNHELPPRVGLLNFPALPLLPGGMFSELYAV